MRHIGNCSKFCKMCRIFLQNRKRDSSINGRTNQRLNTKRKREKRMKLWKRILSCFLALLLTVYLLPVQVMAEELGDLWPLTTENIAETPPDVIGEVLERREENQKEFLLANGVRQVVIYPAAVHYQKDGQWKDIDNRLLPATTRDGETVYQNVAGTNRRLCGII